MIEAIAGSLPAAAAARASSARLRPDAAAQDADEPTVHITIGRVDVRAIPAASAPVAKKPAARPRQALSLDDYLRQRGGPR